MSETEVAGATLPEGIDVDETAAYFGITDSSDVIHELQRMDKHSALARFIELTADLHLSTEEFDFEAASERLNCEGGEIYYLVVGHFGLATIPDALRRFLGMEDSEGTKGAECQLPEEQIELLAKLTNTMTLLGLMAVAQLTSGQGMVVTYARKLEALLSSPQSNLEALLSICNSFSKAMLNAANGDYPEPIEELASGGAAVIPSNTEVQPSVPLPNQQQETSATQNVVAESSMNEMVENVPLPGSSAVVEEPPEPEVPLPSDDAEIVSKPPPVSKDIHVDELTERQVVARADDVFGGAFGDALGVEEEQPEEESAPVIPEEQIQEPEINQPIDNSPTPGEQVQSFLATDTDSDGRLSEDEVLHAVGDQEIADSLFEEADANQDGKITLPEYLDATKPVEESKAVSSNDKTSLPRPVTPKRRPIGSATGVSVQSSSSSEQYVIRSGINCSGCGIGLDPHWRHCVICGIGR